MNTLKKVLIGAGVVWLAALTVLGFVPHQAPKPEPRLGAQIQQEPFWFYNGAQFGPSGITQNNSGTLVMGTGQNQASWQNNTGKTVFISSVDATAFMTTGASTTVSSASTTLALSAGTSTRSTVTDSATPVFGSLFDKVLISTGTPYLAHDGIVNSAFSGSNEQGMVAVANGQWVIFALENPYRQDCAGTVCESATSTNRGYNLAIDFPYWTF